MPSSNLTQLACDEITIRRAQTVADYRACQDAQRKAWGITEESYVIPIATMVGANLHGGLVLGAFLPDGQAVGMSFGFLGRTEECFCFYSQLTGVIPGYQSLGLGYRLKLAQREFARSEGIALMAWAFDPLQAGNARFNLQKLGARVRRYIDNMYGERTDAVSAGVPTDRVIALWQLDRDPYPKTILSTQDALSLPRLIHTGEDSQGLLVPVSVESAFDRPRVLLEIPSRIALMRRDHPELAEQWRLAVRQGFLAAFAAGLVATGFMSEERSAGPRCFYVLEHPEAAKDLKAV
jgi:predicted GNAT superfamily acetyltransferase